MLNAEVISVFWKVTFALIPPPERVQPQGPPHVGTHGTHGKAMVKLCHGNFCLLFICFSCQKPPLPKKTPQMTCHAARVELHANSKIMCDACFGGCVALGRCLGFRVDFLIAVQQKQGAQFSPADIRSPGLG